MLARLSYANVLASLALVLTLGSGIAVGAKLLDSGDVRNNSLKSKDLKNNKAVKGADARNGTIGEDDLADAEAERAVGGPGEPGFGDGGDGDCLWSNSDATAPLAPVSFYRDRERVFLNGVAVATEGAGGDTTCDSNAPGEAVDDHTAFTLPAGYRPDHLELVPINAPSGAQLVVGADEESTFFGQPVPAGAVVLDGTGAGETAAFLDGISFRAAGNGTASAPDRTRATSGRQLSRRLQAPETRPGGNEPALRVEPALCEAVAADCSSATGTIIYVEAVDPDGDGDAHFVLAGGAGITAPGISAIDVARDLRPRRLPRIGDLLSAAGPVYRGSFGQRQIEATEISFARR